MRRTPTLDRWLRRHFLSRLLLVGITFLAFALLFDLMDASDDILPRSHEPLADLGRYVLLRLPSLVGEFFGFAVLFGSLFAVVDLYRHSELVVLWNAGLSTADITRRLLPLVAVLFLGLLAVEDRLVPPTTATLRAWQVGRFSDSFETRTGSRLFAEVGRDVLAVDAAAARGGRLEKVELFLRDSDGLLTGQIRAERAEVRGDVLRLFAGVRYGTGTGAPETLPVYDHPGTVDVATLSLMARPAAELSWSELRRVVAARGYGMRPVHAHRTWLQARFAQPLGESLLLLVPLALLRSYRRTGITTRLFVEAAALGFAWQLGSGLLLALAEGGFLHPAVGAWAMPLLLAAGLLAAFVRAAGPSLRAVAAP